VTNPEISRLVNNSDLSWDLPYCVHFTSFACTELHHFCQRNKKRKTRANT